MKDLQPVLVETLKQDPSRQNSTDEFKVTTPENPLLSKQAVTSKMNPST